eukprot:s4658_g9.t1
MNWRQTVTIAMLMHHGLSSSVDPDLSLPRPWKQNTLDFCVRMAQCLQRQAETRQLQLGQNLSSAQRARQAWGVQTAKAKPLVPEFKSFHHSDVEDPQPGLRLVATPSPGAQQTELPSQDSSTSKNLQKALPLVLKEAVVQAMGRSPVEVAKHRLSVLLAVQRKSDRWLFNPRFALYQGSENKVRAIDDGKRSALNLCYTTNFKLELYDVGTLAALIAAVADCLKSGTVNFDLMDNTSCSVPVHPEVASDTWCGRTLDLSRAYKQLVLDKASRLLSVVGYFHENKWIFFRSDVLPFGAIAAVYTFNRWVSKPQTLRLPSTRLGCHVQLGNLNKGPFILCKKEGRIERLCGMLEAVKLSLDLRRRKSKEALVFEVEIPAVLISLWLEEATGNSAADATSAKGLSMTVAMAHMLTPYFKVMRRYHIFPAVTHIPGHFNELADALSRFKSTLPFNLDLLDQFHVPWRQMMSHLGIRIFQSDRRWPSHFNVASA